MNDAQFNRLLEMTRLRSSDIICALRLVLVKGYPQAKASFIYEVDKGLLSRRLKRLKNLSSRALTLSISEVIKLTKFRSQKIIDAVTFVVRKKGSQAAASNIFSVDKGLLSRRVKRVNQLRLELMEFQSNAC